jgi:hypothetical protein
MNAFLLVIGINAAMFGFVFLFGGFVVLAAPSKDETEEAHRNYQSALAKGWLHGCLFAFNHATSSRNRAFSVVIAHWPERRLGRKLIYCGALCLGVGAVVGYHLGAFGS